MIQDIQVSKDNFRIVQPLLIVARFFGLCPIYYKNQGVNYVLGWSLKYFVYSYVLAVVLILFTIWGLINDLQGNSIRMQNKKSTLITCCDISSVIVIVIYVTIANPFRLKRLIKLLKYCCQIDNMIPQIDAQKYRKKSITFMISVYTISACLFAFDITMWTIRSNHQGLRYCMNFFGFYCLYYILITSEIYFWHMVYLINVKLLLLNEYLELEEENARIIKSNLEIQLNNLRLQQSNKKVTPRNEKIWFKRRFSKNGVFFNHVERIQMLTKMYKILIKATTVESNDVSNGLPLIMLGCLIHLVITPYFFLKEIMNSDRRLGYIVLQVVWILAHSVRLLIIVEPCQKCYVDGQRTFTLVCELLGVKEIDEEFKKAVSRLAMQVSQQQIKFSCYDLFKINRSIITTLAGSISTYIVILFQFNTG